MTSPSWISKSRPEAAGRARLTPAARLGLKGGAFVVDGYSSEPLRLTAVTAKK